MQQKRFNQSQPSKNHVDVVRVIGTKMVPGATKPQVKVVVAFEYLVSSNQIVNMLFETWEQELSLDRRCVAKWLENYKSDDLLEVIDFEVDVVEPCGRHYFSTWSLDTSDQMFCDMMYGTNED